MHERFKVEASINNNRKTLWIIRDVSRTQRNIWDGVFCKNSWLHLTVDYLCKHFILGVSQGYEYSSDEAKQNSGGLSLIPQRDSSTISANFFNLILTLPCRETLITNSIHACLWFQIDSAMHLNTYVINQPLFTCSNSSQQWQTNF